MSKLGVYVHIPFCNKICHYCDFYKMRAKPELKKLYIDHLIEEVHIHQEKVKEPISTLYIGGGTPSSLSLADLNRFFEALDQWLHLQSLEEITFEINPEDIANDLLKLLKEYHIQRLSIGIQSFNEETIRFTNRHYSYEEIAKKIELVKSFGFTNINLDFMYGFPGSSVTSTKQDLERFLSLRPTHISSYSLILEEKTVLYHWYMQGKFQPLDDDIDANLYEEITKTLEANGFHHYEISNFALPGYESKHNLIYWSNQRYIGIGAGSSSYYAGYRTKTIANLPKYFHGIKQSVIGSEEKYLVTPEEAQREMVMLGLRKVDGLSIEEFQSLFQQSIFNAFPTIEEMLKTGDLILRGDYLRIAPTKLYLSNYILRNIL